MNPLTYILFFEQNLIATLSLKIRIFGVSLQWVRRFLEDICEGFSGFHLGESLAFADFPTFFRFQTASRSWLELKPESFTWASLAPSVITPANAPNVCAQVDQKSEVGAA